MAGLPLYPPNHDPLYKIFLDKRIEAQYGKGGDNNNRIFNLADVL
jgi:hypothetical protein